MSILTLGLVTAFASPAPRTGVSPSAHQSATTTQWPSALSLADLAAIWGQAPPSADLGDTTPAGTGVTSAAAGAARTTTTPAAAVVNAAISYARQQLGLPYQWGGNGPQHGDAGFDCSGLTQSSYAAGGLKLPRTAMGEFFAGPVLPPGTDLRPGDLVFYGTLWRVHHVGLYIGRQVMIHAPTFGQPVQVSHYRWSGDDYLGATRPTEGLGGLGSYLPGLPWKLPGGYLPGPSSSGSPGQSGGPATAAAGSTPGSSATSTTSPGGSAPPTGPAPGSPAPAPAPAPSQAPPPSIVPPLPLPSVSPLPLPSLPPLLPAPTP
ncbi:MAG: NlpC/P60 family protein [Pseudonocardiales bacterium]